MPRKGARAASRSRSKARATHDDRSEVRATRRGKDEASTASSSASDANVTTPPASGHKGRTTLYGQVYSLAKRGRKYFVTQLGLALPSVLLTLLGFKELPRSVPLLNIIQQHPVGSPIIGGILLVLASAGLIISFGPEPKDDGNTTKRDKDWHNRLWITATAMSTTSFIASSTFLAIALIRPQWCPSFLCPPVKVIVATNPHGIHDANLEMYFIAFQSPSYVVPDPPAQPPYVPDSRDARSIAAIRLAEQPSPSVYRVVLEAHSLYEGKYSIIVEQVALVIKQVPPLPPSLNVWSKGTPLTYESNLYQAEYNGQEPTQVLVANYITYPHGHVQLGPGESDQLDIQINSHIRAAIQFQVQVVYRLGNESNTHTLILPQIFEVMFSNDSNWRQYQLQEGRFIPKP